MTTAEKVLVPLTERQREVWRWIRDYHANKRIGPSTREIQSQFRYSSPNGVACHIRALVKKGWLQRRPMIARSTIPTMEGLNSEDS